MKKSLLLFVAVLATIQVSFAQEKKVASTTKIKNLSVANHTARKSAPATSSAAGTVVPFWTDDFSNPANWTISNQAGNSDNWVVGVDTPDGSVSGGMGGILSTSVANGFALFDSDTLCSGDQIADITTANPINCTGMDPVVLTFEQYYARWYDSTFVFVSNDNVNWTKYTVNQFFLNNDLSFNPDIVKVDISSTASNQATVWLRFEFYSPSSMGPNAGCGYAWMIDDVSLAVECLSPSAGTLTPVPCPGQTIDLSVALAGTPTIQWEESTDNINWTAVSGATSTTYSVVVNSPVYYRANRTCGTLSAVSNSVEIALNPTAPNCYCIPFSLPCSLTGSSWITNVSITGTTLNSTTSCSLLPALDSTNYTLVDPAVATATLVAGTTYTISLTSSDNDISSVWFDWNQNNEYDAAEWTQIATSSTAGVASTKSFTVPATALNGTTGMRIRTRLSGNLNGSTEACIDMFSGETEDYYITVTGGVGVTENVFENASIKPTITSDVFSVDLGTNNFNNAKLVVTNMQGQTVINNQAVNSQRFDVSLGGFQSGLYLVRVYGTNANFTGRVTVVK